MCIYLLFFSSDKYYYIWLRSSHLSDGVFKLHRENMYKSSYLSFFFFSLVFYIYIYSFNMATNILRRQFATSAQSTLRIGLIPADGIGREGKESNKYKEKENLSPYFSSIV